MRTVDALETLSRDAAGDALADARGSLAALRPETVPETQYEVVLDLFGRE